MRNLMILSGIFAVCGGVSKADIRWDLSLNGTAGIGYAFEDLRRDGDLITGDAAAFTIDTFDNSGLITELDFQAALVGVASPDLSFGALIEGFNLTSRFRDEVFQGQAFVTGNFGTLVFGATDGAYDRVLKENDKGQTILDAPAVAWMEHGSNSGLDNPDTNVLRYDLVRGGFTFSTSITRRTDFDMDTASNITSSDLGVGLAWQGKIGQTTVEVGVARQVNNKDVPTPVPDTRAVREATGFSVSISQDDFGATLTHSKFEREFRPRSVSLGSGRTTFTSISGWKRFGELTLGAIYSEQEQHEFTGGAYSGDAYGVWAEYDLNDNAKISLGHGASEFLDFPTFVEDRRTTMGLIYSF